MKNLTWVTLFLLQLSLSLHAQTPSPERVMFEPSIRKIPLSGVHTGESLAPTVVRLTLTQAETQAPLSFSIPLKMHNLAELQKRISTGEIISAAEMTAKYYPAAADYKVVAAFLTSQGFAVKPANTSSNLSVFASGSVTQIQRAFATTFARVAFAGVEASSAVTAPSLPAAVAGAALGINGLQPSLQPRLHSTITPQDPQALTDNLPPYKIPEIAKAYNASNLSVNGSGQTIAIVINTFPAPADLTSFWEDNGVAQSLNNIEEVQVVSGTLPSPSGEETLDVEWSSGMASGAKVRVYATTDFGFVHLDEAYQAILNDLPSQPSLHQVSLSYGLGETYESTTQMATDAQYFASLAANGVTVFVSSGDGGSSPGTNGFEDNSGPVQVECPANDVNVTAVGGTSLYLDVSTGAVSSEVAWSFGGGGSSRVFARPSWQTGAGVPPGTFRTVPDVALPADINTGGYLVFNGQLYEVGGTSWGAPTWAGLCAVMNQARANIGAPSLGLLGAKIYPLNGTSSFRGITTGCNGPNGVYNAGPGYNMCTGLGVPNVAAMIQALLSSASDPVPAATPVITNFISYSGDFNGAGRQDILWRNMLTGDVRIWYMNGATILSNDFVANIGLEWKIVGIGDFNGDGISDILWQNTINGSFVIWIMHGDSFSSYQYPSPGAQWSITGVADLNNNGLADILWRNVETGAVQVWWSVSPLNFSSEYLSTASLDWNLVGTADLFGNGLPELIWRNQNSGEVRAWQLSGSSLIANVSLGVVPQNWQIVAFGDFSGNGLQDILWQNSVDGSVDVWLMNGYAAPAQLFSAPVPPEWQVRAAPNLFGNKLCSILWSNAVTGQQELWGTTGAPVSGPAQIGIADPDWVVQPSVGK